MKLVFLTFGTHLAIAALMGDTAFLCHYSWISLLSCKP